MRKTAAAAPAVLALAIPSAAVAPAGLRATTGLRATKDREAGAKKGDEQPLINQRGEMMSESLIPFHQQAEDEGTYVLAGRAREAELARPEELSEGPSENAD